MAKFKKKTVRRNAPKAVPLPGPSLAPKLLEEAAQGWLQSSGATAPSSRRDSSQADQRLTEALLQTLQELRDGMAELRLRLDRLERKSG